MLQKAEPIAIVGSGCRFPGGANCPSKLWDLLSEPRDVLRKVPAGRYDSAVFYHPDPTHHGTTNVQESYFLEEDPTKFDNSFFNIQPAESDAIDPQQRMLMETVYDTLCDAGMTIESLRGSSTSVFVGVMCDDWSGLLTRDWDTTPTYASTGMGRSILANRISYFFDWHGPSMTIDTACSSSLIAVHQAVQAISSGESQVALVAGSNLILSPAMYIAESNLRMLSPTGRCRMWDSAADGYGRGEGIAAVLLKPLSAALEDGDHIECIIRATGSNQDGRTKGLTMPSGNAQADLIRSTYVRAGLDINHPMDRPQFFQAHGTGTPAGDPQEAEAIASAFFEHGSPSRTGEKLLVGSVKTIIGHTEGTAGLASLIASIQAIRHGVIPPNMHFDTLSPTVEPFYDHLKIPTVATQWPHLEPGQVRRVSINSFGFGGANAHAIIESFQTPYVERSLAIQPPTPFIFSAASEQSLRKMLQGYIYYLEQHPDVNLRDLAWTLQTRRSTLHFRVAVAARTVDDLSQKIQEVLTISNPSENVLSTRYFNKHKANVLGVFTGQGAQWPRMGAVLIEQSPIVLEWITELDATLASLPAHDRPSWTIKDQLLAPASNSQLHLAEVAQPVCTAVQIILVKLLCVSGIQLHAVIGHSSGEIGAAFAASLISAQEAIRIAYYRGLYAKLARSPSGSRGAMMAIGTTFEDASALCALPTLSGKIEVAACNSPSSITLSGNEEAIDEAMDILADEAKFARKLKVDTAYHSHHMKPCAFPYLKSLEQFRTSHQIAHTAPTWQSSVFSGQIMDSVNLDSQYWVHNMTRPVLFSEAVAGINTRCGPFDLVLEIGPHPALKGPCNDCLEEVSRGAVPPYLGLLARGQDDIITLATAMGQAWTHLGVDSVQFDNLDCAITGNMQPKQMVTELPLYPFSHSRAFYNLSRISGAQIHNHSPPHPLLGRRCDEMNTAQEVQWRNVIRPKELPWLQGHRLQGQIVFAATAYIAMAFDAIAQLSDQNASVFKLEDFVIGRAMGFNDENSSVESLFTLKITTADDDMIAANFACYSSTSSDVPLARHAYGRVTAQFQQGDDFGVPTFPAEDFDLNKISPDRFYASLARIGYEYASPFNCIREIKRKLRFASGSIEDASGSAWEDKMIIHPGMMDTALQTSSAAYSCPDDGHLANIHVPTFIKSLILNPKYTPLGIGKQRSIPYQSVIRESYHGETIADIHLFSENNLETFVQVEGLQLKPFTPPTAEDDVVKFTEFRYCIDNIDGRVAVGDDKPTSLDVERAFDLERIAYFYLRNLQDITLEVRVKALPHYQKLLDWADHVVAQVTAGEHHAVLPEHNSDNKEIISQLIAKHPDRVDVKLVEVVGENLPQTIKDNSNILEHMTKDGVLDDFYAIETAQNWLARLAGQIAHRYPRMKILEIGAGTGGTTRIVLPELGQSFSTYTYTDISSGFFENAEARFQQYASRMIFKTFDMERTPESQGFINSSYDLIIAANVLHATNKLDDMMSHVRRLLRPGGYLIVFEVITNKALQVGLPMGGLPGWWVGAESGRPWGPTLDLRQWDNLLKRNGFSGLVTVTPPYHKLHPGAVFAAQAVDDYVKILGDPLNALQDGVVTSAETLVIAGGTDRKVLQAVQEIQHVLTSKWKKVYHVFSIDELVNLDLHESSSVLSLVELDEPIFKSPTSAKHKALKVLWAQGRNILWVTKGCRDQEPYSLMTVGLSRTMRTEYPHLNLQLLDVDSLDSRTGKLVAEYFLRLELWDLWTKRRVVGNHLWTVEPEIVIQDGRALIPRLRPRTTANLRYNCLRRQVKRHVNPQKDALELKRVDLSIVPQEISPLHISTDPLQADSAIKVTYSLTGALQIGGLGYVMLVAGTSVGSCSPLLGLAFKSQSPAPTLASWTVPQSDLPVPQQLIVIGAFIVAEQISSLAPPSGTLLVHGAERPLALALLHQARLTGVSILLTTSNQSYTSGVLHLKPNLPQRLVKRALPKDIYSFVDCSPDSASDNTSRKISMCLPRSCAITTVGRLFGREVDVIPKSSAAVGALALKAAVEAADSSKLSLDEARIIPLSKSAEYAHHLGAFNVLDWTEPTVSVAVHTIDQGVLFAPNKTFVLIGLAGELGRSLTRWMIEHGAKNIVLTSRQPKVDDLFMKSMAEYGANVKVIASDVSSRVSLQECIAMIRSTMPPIAGVANGAMVLRDSMFANMDFEDWMICTRPKVVGTALLDEIFYDDPLDFFIVFSSITTVVGNSGQSNYAAANMFMTGVAARRRKRGLAASTIDISSLIGLGYVERSDRLNAESFTRLGYTNISEPDLHQLFAEAVLAGQADSEEIPEIVTGVSPVYSDEEIPGSFYSDPKFAHFTLDRASAMSQTDTKTLAVSVRTLLADVTNHSQIEDVIREEFLARMKRTLQIPPDERLNENVSLVELGLDSLMAVEVRTWFLKELGIDMPVLKILAGGTTNDLVQDAANRQTFKKFDDADRSIVSDSGSANENNVMTTTISSIGESPTPAIGQCKETTVQQAEIDMGSMEIVAALSYGQERFWFLHNYLEDPTTLNMAVMFRLTGPLRTNALRQAVRVVSQRHEALRTRIIMPANEDTWNVDNDEDSPEPKQGIMPTSAVGLQEIKIDTAEQAQQQLQLMHTRVWDLRDPRAIRWTLLSRSEHDHYLIVGCHHITLDGLSFSVLFVDLEAAYSSMPLAPITSESQYRSFAAQQRSNYDSGLMKASIDFFRCNLPSNPQPIPLLPFAKELSRCRPLERYMLHSAHVRLDCHLGDRIRQIARTYRSTAFHFYVTALQAQIFRFLAPSGIREFCLGVADANRLDGRFLGTVGFMLNLLPLSCQRNSGTFREALQVTRDTIYATLEHSSVPFDVLLAELRVPRAPEHSPLFQIFVDYRQIVRARERFGECTVSEEQWCNARTGYDVRLEVTEQPGGEVDISLNLQDTWYSRESTEMMLDQFAQMLREFSDDVEMPFSSDEMTP